MTAMPQLASRVHEIAWSAVHGPAADPWAGTGGTRQERRSGSLQLLALYSQLVKVLQRRIDLTIKDALDAGSDYGEIAAACGVSRQAIRQRWLRRTADPRWFEAWRPAPRAGDQAGRQPLPGGAQQAVLVRANRRPVSRRRRHAVPRRGPEMRSGQPAVGVVWPGTAPRVVPA
jgi:hypothetical protein